MQSKDSGLISKWQGKHYITADDYFPVFYGLMLGGPRTLPDTLPNPQQDPGTSSSSCLRWRLAPLAQKVTWALNLLPPARLWNQYFYPTTLLPTSLFHRLSPALGPNLSIPRWVLAHPSAGRAPRSPSPGCTGGPRVHSSGQGQCGQAVSGPSPATMRGVGHCHPARAWVCKRPMPHTKHKTLGWREIIYASLFQGGRKAAWPEQLHGALLAAS